MGPTNKLSLLIMWSSRREIVSVPRSTIISLMTICFLIFIFVPWQVAYLGCCLLHLHTCAFSQRELASLIQRSRIVAVPLVQFSSRRENDEVTDDRSSLERQSSGLLELKRDNVNHNMHFLLLMTWLLPLTAPVLAVWVRTLLTAGLTTPFDGDHNFLAVVPFLVLTDFASWTPGRLFERPRSSFGHLSLFFALMLSYFFLLLGLKHAYRYVGYLPS